jgi:hypothetical protein
MGVNHPGVCKIYRYAKATDRIAVWSIGEARWSTGTLLSTLQLSHAQQERGKHTAGAVLVPLSSPGRDVGELEVFRFHFAGSSLVLWTMSKADGGLNFVRVGWLCTSIDRKSNLVHAAAWKHSQSPPFSTLYTLRERAHPRINRIPLFLKLLALSPQIS